jgi:transcriptional regulator NrdR family protein
MNCPRCAAWTSVIETRKLQTNAVYRRLECANSHRFSTYEISDADYFTLVGRRRFSGVAPKATKGGK